MVPSRRRAASAAFLSVLMLNSSISEGFVSRSFDSHRPRSILPESRERLFRGSLNRLSPPRSSSPSLKVWWFGGTESSEVTTSTSEEDSCELVAVRIDRTSPNSRRIAGEISVPAKLEDVWSILTDYDRLSIHVPNLMESRITQRYTQGEAGDGAFRCRLFQKGAQKIIGFDFSASVTMDMTEKVTYSTRRLAQSVAPIPEERMIGFKCVDSQFFSTFDGEWKVKEQINELGETETVCSYTVDVRPKGPVPVAALEWRIREDVPTNLRAVKAATLRLDRPRTIGISPGVGQQPRSLLQARGMPKRSDAVAPEGKMTPVMVDDWDYDETMAKYL